MFGDDADFEAGVRLARERFKAISGKALGSLKDVNKAAGPDTTGALAAGMKALLHDHDTLLEPTIKALVEAVASELTPAPGTVPTLGNIGVSPDGPISAATGIAVTATFATWLASFAGIHENESLKHFAELFASAVGYEEMRDVLIGPLVRHGIAAVADLQAKARFQQSLPGHAAVASWLARQLISEGDARRLAAYDGLNSTLMGIETTAAQSALNPRMLLQLIQTGLFTDDDLQDEMTFNGVRPRSQHRLVMAAPYLATRSERDQLRSTLELAYANGLLADRELVDQVNAIEHNTDRGDLILRNAKWKKTIAITKDLETEYSTLFKGGLLDDAGFKNHLEGLGLQPDMVDAIAAKSEAQAEAALQRQTIRTAAALARTTAGEERRAAVKNYQAGILDAAGLHAALVATGLTVLQASAWVALAVATKSGNQRWIYGLQLTPDEAALLRSRVAALTAQRKRNQITDQQYVEQLRALNIPDRYVNALRANADALVTPKSSAFAVPLQTS